MTVLPCRGLQTQYTKMEGLEFPDVEVKVQKDNLLFPITYFILRIEKFLQNMCSYNTVDEPALEDTPSRNRPNGLLSITTAVSCSLFIAPKP